MFRICWDPQKSGLWWSCILNGGRPTLLQINLMTNGGPLWIRFNPMGIFEEPVDPNPGRTQLAIASINHESENSFFESARWKFERFYGSTHSFNNLRSPLFNTLLQPKAFTLGLPFQVNDVPSPSSLYTRLASQVWLQLRRVNTESAMFTKTRDPLPLP